ncbi:MAG: nodulation protein NfeD, partial [Deltaproteobacteria bacterium]
MVRLAATLPMVACAVLASWAGCAGSETARSEGSPEETAEPPTNGDLGGEPRPEMTASGHPPESPESPETADGNGNGNGNGNGSVDGNGNADGNGNG